ncbi:MAG: hypothetical protein VZR24_00095 [Butyrivibrio hungatei]|nr:hypothetical protein [Butyrivibrio hungatei]
MDYIKDNKSITEITLVEELLDLFVPIFIARELDGKETSNKEQNTEDR